jgi:hypothetical protein
MHAIQLMQKDPKTAMSQFQNDADVTLFLKEFGSVMGKHFEGISASSSGSQEQSGPSKSIVDISRTSSTEMGASMGPLHAKVIEEDRRRMLVIEFIF